MKREIFETNSRYYRVNQKVCTPFKPAFSRC